MKKFRKIKKHLDLSENTVHKARRVFFYAIIELKKAMGEKRFNPKKFVLTKEDLVPERLYLANVDNNTVKTFKALVKEINMPREHPFTQGEVFRIAVDKLYKKYCYAIKAEEKES